MSRTGDIIPVDATEQQLRDQYGPDATQVIAFRRFLGVISDSDQLHATKKLAEPHRGYARGELTAEEYLAALELVAPTRLGAAVPVAIVLSLLAWILLIAAARRLVT